MSNIFKRKKTQRFGEIAVNKGMASEHDVQEALKEQKEYAEKHKIHKEIGVFLTEKGILTPDDVKIILEEQHDNKSLMAWFTALFNLNR
ncbi:MAG: hypothetical protein ABH869_03865 [Candidatus Omnitrophota bacterium]